METIFKEYQTRCDFFYLFANDTVLNFYPKFGFHREWEYQTSSAIEKHASNMIVEKLDMDNPTEKNTFTRLINNAVSFAKISMIGNPGLIMFYCNSLMKDDIYYLPELDLAAVVKYKGNTMYLHDVFCEREFDLNTVLDALLTQDKGKVIFGFTPVTNQNYVCELKNDDDDALFVKVNSKFVLGQEMFPVLSHA